MAGKKTTEKPPLSFEAVLLGRKDALKRVRTAITNLHDPVYIEGRVKNLREKEDLLEQEISILNGVAPKKEASQAVLDFMNPATSEPAAPATVPEPEQQFAPPRRNDAGQAVLDAVPNPSTVPEGKEDGWSPKIPANPAPPITSEEQPPDPDPEEAQPADADHMKTASKAPAAPPRRGRTPARV